MDVLTDLPVTVLNSHDHFDHIGENSYFDEVWCYNLPSAIQHLTQGPTETEQYEVLDSTKSIHPYLEFYGLTIPERISGKAPTGTVKDGQVIDLGGRKLEVIHTPGHQPSCIMLLDRENHLLFTGDMFYPGPMYCLFDDSSFPDYVKSIRKAADLAVEAGVSEVYCSHNLASVPTEDLCRFADYLEAIDPVPRSASQAKRSGDLGGHGVRNARKTSQCARFQWKRSRARCVSRHTGRGFHTAAQGSYNPAASARRAVGWRQLSTARNGESERQRRLSGKGMAAVPVFRSSVDWIHMVLIR